MHVLGLIIILRFFPHTQLYDNLNSVKYTEGALIAFLLGGCSSGIHCSLKIWVSHNSQSVLLQFMVNAKILRPNQGGMHDLSLLFTEVHKILRK